MVDNRAAGKKAMVVGPPEISQIKDSWIKKQMERRMDEFTDQSDLHIFIGTWNVNAKKETDRLESWLKPESLGDVSPDIYAIGMQEIVDLNAVKVISNQWSADPWNAMFKKCLSDDYIQVDSKQLVGLLLTIFVKKVHYPHISEIMYKTTKVGVLGVGGNKGSIAIRFSIYDSTICILNAHLAAHQNNINGRNANFSDILQHSRFVVPSERGQASRSFPIDSHDFLFWMGDLNYRINIPDIDRVFDLIEAGHLNLLLAQDQLLDEKAKNNVFQNFREGLITFPPTYKYQPNSNVYERREDKKKRAPAWCDRILWSSRSKKTAESITQVFYSRDERLLMSDHKPVMSLFRVTAKVLVKEKQHELYQSLVRQLDAWDNSQVPKVAMSTNSVHFPSVRYGSVRTQLVQCRNEGEVAVRFF